MRKLTVIVALATSIAGCDKSGTDKAGDNKVDCQASGCSNDVEIVATDYAFEPPAQIPSGRITFQFANRGKVRHELSISRLKPGASMEEFVDSVRAGKSVKSLILGPVGVLFAPPGQSSAAGLSLDASAGERYALICVFTDKEGAKPHYELGMFKLVSVAGRRPVTGLPQAATDTVVATDYAFQYPRVVSPGRHTFVLRNDGKVRHEFGISLLRKGVTVSQVLEMEKRGANVDSLFEATDFGILHAHPGITPFGELTLDMLPGREYMIACFFKDDAKSPEHYALGMYGSIQVSPKPTT